jgi:hypothetical protein
VIQATESRRRRYNQNTFSIREFLLSQQQKIIAAVLAVLVIVGGAFIASRPVEDTPTDMSESADTAPRAAPTDNNAGVLETPIQWAKFVLARLMRP